MATYGYRAQIVKCGICGREGKRGGMVHIFDRWECRHVASCRRRQAEAVKEKS